MKTAVVSTSKNGVTVGLRFGAIIEVDPAAYSVDHTYTWEMENPRWEGTKTWTGVSPHFEEDGRMFFFLPLPWGVGQSRL